MTITW